MARRAWRYFLRTTRWDSWDCVTGRGSSFMSSSRDVQNCLTWSGIRERSQISPRTRQCGRRGMERPCAAGAVRRSNISRQALRLAETISETSLGEQIFGSGGIVLEPVAQLMDEGAE